MAFENLQKISVSEIDTYATCRQKHHWQYTRRLIPPASEMSEDKLIGTAGHIGMQALLLSQDTDKAIDRWVEKELKVEEGEILIDSCADFLRECARKAKSYVKKFQKEQGTFGLTPIQYMGKPFVERWFEYPIPELRTKIVGKIDTIVKDQDGNNLLVEWKFPRNFRKAESLEFDNQIGVYQYIARELFVPVVGTLYIQLRNKEPALPKILKGGTISKDKRITTDWETYSQFVVANGGRLSDYQDMKEHLESENENRFFQSDFVYRSPIEVDFFYQNLYNTIKEQKRPNNGVFMEPNRFNCQYCEYAPLCGEMIRGRDVESYIHDYYAIKGENNV